MVMAMSNGSPAGGAKFGKLRHQRNDVLAQQRLAAGQPDFPDSQADEDADHAQVILHGQFGKLGALPCRCGNRRICSCIGR